MCYLLSVLFWGACGVVARDLQQVADGMTVKSPVAGANPKPHIIPDLLSWHGDVGQFVLPKVVTVWGEDAFVRSWCASLMPCCRRGYRAEQAAAEEGATFAVWYDEIDRLHRGYGSYDLWPVIDGMVHVLAQKMWGPPTAPRSYEEHCALAERVGNIPCCDPLHRAAEPFELAPKRFPLRKEGRMSTFVLPLQQLGALSKVRCSVSN